MKENNKIFYSSLILTLIILSLIIYVSSVQPSKEEFVEIYWQVSRSDDLISTDRVDCRIEGCSQSGTYYTGSIDLSGMNFGLITTDLYEFEDYGYTCIDFNDNDTFCEETEGPFVEGDTFFIDNNGFNIFSISDKNIVVAHYPKKVSQENFTVGFVVKSVYHKPLDIDIKLLVETNETETKIQNLKPNEEIVSSFNVKLPAKGLYKVKVVISSATIDRENEIYFWVERI